MFSCLLKGDQLTRQVAGYFPRVLVHELRRGRGVSCILASACTAVGDYFAGSSTPLTLAETTF